MPGKAKMEKLMADPERTALRETLRIHRETGMHLPQQAEQDLKRYFRMVFMDLLCRTAYREAAL